MKLSFFLSAFLLLSFAANAQLAKTIHQTFDLGEAETVALQLQGDVEIETWAGNSVMTETQIELYDATPAVLKYFVEELGRYEIEAKEQGTGLALVSKDQTRRSIQYKGQQCFETTRTKVFVPDTYEVVGDTQLRRKVEATE